MMMMTVAMMKMDRSYELIAAEKEEQEKRDRDDVMAPSDRIEPDRY